MNKKLLILALLTGPIVHIKSTLAASATDEEITNLYKDVLGREPDAEGAAWWKSAGISAEEVKKGFLESEEYKNRSKPAPATKEEITGLYKSVLGREADVDGATWWKNTGVSAEEVKESFLESDEYKNKNKNNNNTNQAASAQVTTNSSTIEQTVAEAPKAGVGYVDCGDLKYNTNTVKTNIGKTITPDNYVPGMVCYTTNSVGKLLAGPQLRDPIYNDLLAKEKANDLEFSKYRETMGELDTPEKLQKYSEASDKYTAQYSQILEERSILQSKRNFYFTNGYNAGSTNPQSNEKFTPTITLSATPPANWKGYYNPKHPDWTVDPKEYFKDSPNILEDLNRPGSQAGAAIQGQNNPSSIFYEKVVTFDKYNKVSLENSKKCTNMLPAPHINYQAYITALESAAYADCLKSNNDLFEQWKVADSKLLEKENRYWNLSKNGLNPYEKDNGYSNEAALNTQTKTSLSKTPSKTDIKTCSFDLGTDIQNSVGALDQAVQAKVIGDITYANAQLALTCKKLGTVADASGVNATEMLTDYTKSLADISDKVSQVNLAFANQAAIPITGKLSSYPLSINSSAAKYAIRASNNAASSVDLYNQSANYSKLHEGMVKGMSSNGSLKANTLVTAISKKTQALRAISAKKSSFKTRATILSEIENASPAIKNSRFAKVSLSAIRNASSISTGNPHQLTSSKVEVKEASSVSVLQNHAQALKGSTPASDIAKPGRAPAAASSALPDATVANVENQKILTESIELRDGNASYRKKLEATQDDSLFERINKAHIRNYDKLK